MARAALPDSGWERRVAKALVQARGLPALDRALAAGAGGRGRAGRERLVLAVANALRGEVYAAAYRFFPERIQTELAPSVRRPEELVGSGLQPAVVVGEAPAEILASSGELDRPSRSIGPPEGAPHAAGCWI